AGAGGTGRGAPGARHRRSPGGRGAEKAVGPPFWSRRRRLARVRPPGRAETVACVWTIAAKAPFAEPSRRNVPAVQVRARGTEGGVACFVVPPQPAATNTAKRVKVVKVL